MKISVEEFRRLYDGLSDEALLDIERGDLVEVARACYDEELARRGLSAPAPASATSPRDTRKYVVAATLASPEEAKRACAMLSARQIPAHTGTDTLEVLVPAAMLDEAQEFFDGWISDEQAEEAVASSTYVRHGMGSVRPYIYGKSDLIEFVQEVFGAVELERFELKGKCLHVEAAIGDSVVVMEVGDPLPANAAPSSIHVYVPDVDAAYGRALELGAEEVSPPEDRPNDERSAVLKDGAGNTWWIATYQAP